MSYTISKVDVWAADIPNRAGTLSGVIESMADSGAMLEFMIARKVNARTSRVFIAPIKGAKLQRAAKKAGLVRAKGMHSLRIEGPDRPGLGTKITQAISEEGINLRGASAAAIGRKAVFHIAVENEKDLKSAITVVRKVLRK